MSDNNTDFQRTITHIALDACADAGFVLAGGSALREHGITNRPTADVDLFTNNNDPEHFADAVARTHAALEATGLHVSITRQLEGFATLAVSNTMGESVDMDMGRDWRAHDHGVTLDIGPVLHQDDAVANKVLAVFGRTEARDFLDLDAIITTGDYPMSALLRLAKDYDPGFDAHYFEGSLRQVTTINADRVAAYGVSAGEWGSVQQRVLKYADHVAAYRAREVAEQALPPLDLSRHTTTNAPRDTPAPGTSYGAGMDYGLGD